MVDGVSEWANKEIVDLQAGRGCWKQYGIIIHIIADIRQFVGTIVL
jgi:hypothetical protein